MIGVSDKSTSGSLILVRILFFESQCLWLINIVAKLCRAKASKDPNRNRGLAERL